MKIARTRSVKMPERGTEGSAGLDFFVPHTHNPELLSPGEACIIPSGVKVKPPRGTALVLFNKSGVATKKGLQVGACVIDEDYQGEVHIHLTNIGEATIEILPGDKIVQGLLLNVGYPDIVEVAPDDLYTETTERGEGRMGHTDEKDA